MESANPLWAQSFPEAANWNTSIERGTLDDMFRETLRKCPHAPALEFRGHVLTFAQLGEMVERLASGLLAQGVRHGEPVAMFFPNCLFHPMVFFALARIGAPVVSLSPLDAARELKHKIELTGAKRLVTINQPTFLGRAIELAQASGLAQVWVADDAEYPPTAHASTPLPDLPFVSPLRALLDEPTPVSWPSVAADDPALLQFTGGTTGKPKAAILTHANLRAAVGSIHDWTDGMMLVSGQERAIGVLPLFHIYAVVTVLLRNVREGNVIFLHERFDADAVLRDISVNRASVFAAVPTMWIALLHHPATASADFSSLKNCVSGSAPIPMEVKTRLEGIIKTRIGGGWGMTETSSAGTRVPARAPARSGIIGTPLPHVELRVVSLDDPKQVLGAGEIGELAIRGPNVFKGYYRDEAATNNAFVDGYFLTGDIGRVDAQGVFDIVDRRKNMILSGGYNVYPAAIEEAIYEHPGVEEVIVIGVDDDYRGQAAKAFIKLKNGAPDIALDDLQAFLKDRLGRHEIPRSLEIRKSLPKSAVGKLLPRALIEEIAAQASPSKQESIRD